MLKSLLWTDILVRHPCFIWGTAGISIDGHKHIVPASPPAIHADTVSFISSQRNVQTQTALQAEEDPQ